MMDDDAPPDLPPPAAPPLLQRPVYIDPAPGRTMPALKSAVGDACDACRKIPGSGLIGATLLGVTAAYFAPKIFDWALVRLRGEGDDQPDEYELEVEP